MLSSKQGSIYRVILAFIIGMAFCFALTWPQYAKHRNRKLLSEAAELGRALAFAESSYRQQHNSYTPKFQLLNITLPCPMVSNGQGPHMDCPDYTYELEENNIIRVSHKNLPVWLEVDIQEGDVQCKYEENNWAGQDLCAHMQ